jgi:hypothetical protein
MPIYNNGIFSFAQTGAPFQHLGSIVLESPKAASNQPQNYVRLMPNFVGPTGCLPSWQNRFYPPIMDVRISGYQPNDV